MNDRDFHRTLTGLTTARLRLKPSGTRVIQRQVKWIESKRDRACGSTTVTRTANIILPELIRGQRDRA
ncbi:MAG: hypothetical protein AAFX40_13760 [Cyanobacteria bacterium J06639_1]